MFVCLGRQMLMHIFWELSVWFCLISIVVVHKQGAGSCSHSEGGRVK